MNTSMQLKFNVSKTKSNSVRKFGKNMKAKTLLIKAITLDYVWSLVNTLRVIYQYHQK